MELSVLIKRVSRDGADSKLFKAFHRSSGKPIGVSCSTTGNEHYAILRCAAKAFVKIAGVGDTDEFETRIITTNISSGRWEAFLES